MNIGKLRKRVVLQAEAQTPDGAGGYTLAWATVATVWATIAPASGHEIYVSGHLEGRVTHKVTMRWRGDLSVTADMRLLYGTRVFNIRAALNIGEENRQTVLFVEEGCAT